MAIVDRVAQWVNDASLKSRGSATRRLARIVRKQLLRSTDPIISIDIDGIRMRAQLSHELPHYRRVHRLYAVNVAALAQFISETRVRPTMIDVGANIGDTAALVRSRVPGLPLLCIEGDAQYSDILKQNVSGWPNVVVHAPCLLAESTGELSGSLNRDAGTAAFAFDSERSATTETLDDVLARYPQFASPALIKSDTDGFEGRVFAGSLRTLDHAQPVLFFEYDPSLLEAYGTKGRELLEMLRDHGYATSVVYDNFGAALGLADLQDSLGIDQIERFADDPSLFYVDIAAFPSGKRNDATELYKRERVRTGQRS